MNTNNVTTEVSFDIDFDFDVHADSTYGEKRGSSAL